MLKTDILRNVLSLCPLSPTGWLKVTPTVGHELSCSYTNSRYVICRNMCYSVIHLNDHCTHFDDSDISRVIIWQIIPTFQRICLNSMQSEITAPIVVGFITHSCDILVWHFINWKKTQDHWSHYRHNLAIIQHILGSYAWTFRWESDTYIKFTIDLWYIGWCSLIKHISFHLCDNGFGHMLLQHF